MFLLREVNSFFELISFEFCVIAIDPFWLYFFLSNEVLLEPLFVVVLLLLLFLVELNDLGSEFLLFETITDKEELLLLWLGNETWDVSELYADDVDDVEYWLSDELENEDEYEAAEDEDDDE